MARFRNGDEKKKPAQSFTAWTGAGLVEVSVWKNTGENGDTFAVTLHRAYKQGEEWKRTDSFFEQDLLVAAHLLETAFDWLQQQE